VDVVVDVAAAAAVTEAAAHRGAAAVIVEWMQFLAHWPLDLDGVEKRLM
jgi:hypothetical protein